ncbi:outer membrane autotransporter protein [Azorhizobium sp. AG788]|uniref:autotransporter outer membrane beta-barrel domain-containing protein n=1 Tax=Azorhizobium sp. AG788 TaxID=2183897 RepID=UPI00105DC470|nr:autotransporter domain-containing protein [Azorhizobium sp. AG788]TDT96439.1 outer membrane autotransporter protein [Azorhizobium sp. AG788]
MMRRLPRALRARNLSRVICHLALAMGAVPAGAQSSGWSLYNGYSTSYSIPYANTPVFGGPQAQLMVNVTVGGQTTQVQVDTGSQGLVIPQYLFGNQTFTGTPGTIVYSSSGNNATGIWTTMTVSFPGAKDQNGNPTTASASVPVFIEQTANNGTKDCTVAGTGCYFMMGIGYGRPDNGWTGYQPSLNTNPLLHLTGMDEGTVRSGYIVTATGIQAGLTAANAGQGYALIQLQPSTGQASANWTTPPGTLIVTPNGGSPATTALPVLVDTGISYLWGNLGTASTACTYHNQQFTCAPAGTAVTVYLGPGSYVGYSYVVGGSNNNSAAPPASRDDAIGALNTGISPLAQFDLMFDAVGGFAGYKATAPNTSGIYFSPYLSTAGALSVPDGFLTTLPVYVSSATTLSTTGTATLQGAVTGVAGLTVAGPGNTSFFGTVTLPSITISGGAASFLANVTAPQFQVLSGAAAANSATLTATVSNAGTLINAGTIVGGVSNSGTVFNWQTVTGAVQSSGTFANTGTVNGTVTNSGTLTNDGTINGIVISTGTMNGNGIVTGSLAVSGTVAPGHSIGTMAVNGNVELRRGSVYEAELGPAGTSDRILASGSVTLDGTRIAVSPYAGYTPGLGSYQIITAGGGVSGTYSVSAPDFGTLSATYPFLAANGRITGSGLTIDMVRSTVPFAAAGITANETATGRGLDTLGQQGTLFNALLGLNAATAAGAYDQLSGEIYASTQSLLIDQSFYVRDGVLGRLRQESGAPGAAGAVQTATLVPGLPLTLWGEGYGGWGQASGNGNSAGDSRSIGGFLMGLDLPLGTNWRAGLAGGYSQSTFNTDARGSSGTSDNYDVALYAGGALAAVGPGTLNLRTGAAYAWHDIAMSRSAAFSGFANALTAGYGADTAQVFAELGYGFTLEKTPLGRVGLEPFAGLAYVHLSTDSLTETFGAAALSVASSSFDTTLTQLGVRASAVVLPGPNLPAVDVHGLIGWQHAFGDTVPMVAASFASGSLPFTVSGAPIATDSLLLGFGLDTAIGQNARLGVAYTGQLASNVQDSAVKGTFSLRF